MTLVLIGKGRLVWGGVDLQEQRSLGLHIYGIYGYWDALESDFWYGSNYRNHTF